MRLPSSRPVRVAVYSALAVGLYTVENLIPSPLPWLRVGVSNIAILLALDGMGAACALAVFFLKLFLGSMLVGRLFTPFFWFALAGGGAGLAAMVLCRFLFRRALGIVGVSIVGGVFHNAGQLAVAGLLLVPGGALLMLLPVLVLVGAVTGGLVGAAARAVQLRLLPTAVRTEWGRDER